MFALLLSLTAALVYQLASRRFGWRILLYWFIALAGLIGAEALAESIGWNVSRVGDLRLLPDLAGAGSLLMTLWFLGF